MVLVDRREILDGQAVEGFAHGEQGLLDALPQVLFVIVRLDCRFPGIHGRSLARGVRPWVYSGAGRAARRRLKGDRATGSNMILTKGR